MSKRSVVVVSSFIMLASVFIYFSIFFVFGSGPIPIWPISEFVISKVDPIVARLIAKVSPEDITQFLKELSIFTKNNEFELKSPAYDGNYPSYYLAFYHRNDEINLLIDLKRSNLTVTWYSRKNNQQTASKLALSMPEGFSQVHLRLDKSQ